MKKETKKSIITYESVKMKKDIVDKVKADKDKTGVPISVFFEKAAEEKLSQQSKKSKL